VSIFIHVSGVLRNIYFISARVTFRPFKVIQVIDLGPNRKHVYATCC